MNGGEYILDLNESLRLKTMFRNLFRKKGIKINEIRIIFFTISIEFFVLESKILRLK